MNGTNLDRIERERAYHNDRFTEETRVHQGKYYFALRDLEQLYEQEVLAGAEGADVLEYGCAKGEWSIKVAPKAKSLQGIDISDVAIEAAATLLTDAGFHNCSFSAMNAEAMNFPDESFDLVFGSGILHHLDLEKSYSELARVLRPGGRAIFKEPLGYNLLLNAYRAVTPSARTPDEHPLLRPDFDLARRYFSKVDLQFFGLTTLASVPLRNTRIGESAYRLAASFDRVLTRFPGMRWQAWYVLMIMEKDKTPAAGNLRPLSMES